MTTPAGTWITPANRAIWIPAGCWHEHRFHGHTQFHGVALDPERYRRGPEAPTVLAVLYDQLQTTGIREPFWIPTPRDSRLRQACELIADDLAAPLTLQQIGTRIGVSQRTLSRLFGEELGMTFPQWRTQLRLPPRDHAASRAPRGQFGGTELRVGRSECFHRHLPPRLRPHAGPAGEQ